MRIVEGENIDSEAWADLVNRSPVVTWFQTREAYTFFASLSFLQAFAYAVEVDGQLKGMVVGYLQKDGGKLKRFFSRRAIVFGGPLLDEAVSVEALAMLLQCLKERAGKDAIYIELRNFNDYSHWRSTFEKCGFRYEPHYDIHVDTSSIDVVLEHLGKSRKRDVRVSMRNGTKVVEHPTMSQIHEYYGVLSNLYTTKVKAPLFPIEFFERFSELDAAVFLLVEFEGRIIGGTVCVGLPEVALYEMYACGEDGVHKNIFPSEVATFAGLQYAAEHDYKKFDMMGAGKPDDGGYGVRDFKLKFGGDLLELGRFTHINKPFLYNIGKTGVSLMKKL